MAIEEVMKEAGRMLDDEDQSSLEEDSDSGKNTYGRMFLVVFYREVILTF